MKKMNKKIIGTCIAGGTAMLLLLIGIVVVIKGISTELEAPIQPASLESTIQNITDVSSSSKPDIEYEYISEYAELFDDPKRLEANLGEYQCSYELDDSKVKGTVSGLREIMPNTTMQQRAAAEYLLINNPYHSIQHVQVCTKKVPKYYGGDVFWLFEDNLGYVGELVVKDSTMYLYYYGELQLENDAILLSGLPATSHGELQTYTDELLVNELYNDLPTDEADAVLYAIQNGEGFSRADDCYLMEQRIFEYADLFEDVKAYFININLSQVFVEVYISDGKYYNIRTTNQFYQDLVPARLKRNSTEVVYQRTTEELPYESNEITLRNFYTSVYAEFVWDGKSRKLFDSVLDINTELNDTILQSLQYGLEKMDINKCQSIRVTDTINGYSIPDENIFEIRISANEEGLPDYYASVIESSHTVLLYLPDVTPKL